MLPKWLTALLVLLHEAWSARRDAHIRFLKLQVEILKERLPGNRVILDPVERRRLMKIGAEVDHRVEDTLGIVSIKTYRRWQREERGGREPGKVGRPRLAKSLRELIIRLAKENGGWGVRRIVGELKKLALRASRSTVRRVLVDEKILPDPDRRAPAVAGACSLPLHIREAFTAALDHRRLDGHVGCRGRLELSVRSISKCQPSST